MAGRSIRKIQNRRRRKRRTKNADNKWFDFAVPSSADLCADLDRNPDAFFEGKEISDGSCYFYPVFWSVVHRSASAAVFFEKRKQQADRSGKASNQ